MFLVVMAQTNDTMPSQQEPLRTQNSIYVTGGTLALWFTGNFSYERWITQFGTDAKNTLYARATYGGYATWGAQGHQFGPGLTLLSGKKNSTLETGLGVQVLYNEEGFRDEEENYVPGPGVRTPNIWNFMTILPDLRVGYRYQKPEGKFLFRTGLSLPDAIYIGFGATF
jgi:hypothetical protein